MVRRGTAQDPDPPGETPEQAEEELPVNVAALAAAADNRDPFSFFNTEDDDDDEDYIVEEDDDEDEELDVEMDEDDQASFEDLVLEHLRGYRSNGAYRNVASKYPLICDYFPPSLEGDLADDIVKRTAAMSPAQRAQMPQNLSKPQNLSPPFGFLIRENGLAGGDSKRIVRSFAAHHRLPIRPSTLLDRMESRGYIGRFTGDGNLFVAAYQNEKKIKVYDTNKNFAVVKDIHARNLRWTVTDVAMSLDNRFLLYSSITPVVHMVTLDTGSRDSVANVTDVHHDFNISRPDNTASAIWSLRWSGDSREVIAGTGDDSLYVYDVERSRHVCRVEGHQDDVNAVAYAEPDLPSCPIIFTGSDDNEIKVWDRRMLAGGGGDGNGGEGASSSGGSNRQPVGVFIGHTEGVAHLDPKGDGRYLISNAKDQTVRLWDLRKGMRSAKEASEIRRTVRGVPNFSWDYRWMGYPAQDRVITHPADGAIAAYRGHQVLGTLCRAYWSPAASTGQKYIYVASANGDIIMYDVISCRIAETLSYHHETVRDCSWHPYLPLLVSVGFDGCMVQWDADPKGEDAMDADEMLAAFDVEKKDGPGAVEAALQRKRKTLMPLAAMGDQQPYW